MDMERILVLEDQPDWWQHIKQHVEQAGFAAVWSQSVIAFRRNHRRLPANGLIVGMPEDVTEVLVLLEEIVAEENPPPTLVIPVRYHGLIPGRGERQLATYIPEEYPFATVYVKDAQNQQLIIDWLQRLRTAV